MLLTELERVRDKLAYLDLVDAKAHLSDFVRLAWPIVEPGVPMLWNWHLDLLCEYLEAVTFEAEPHPDWTAEHGSADPIRKLIINEPPGYCKSLIVSVMWPCWEWTHRPQLRTIFSSYSSDLAVRHSLHRRAVLESDWYRAGMRTAWGFPRFALADDENLKTHYSNMVTGEMVTVSTGSRAMGMHGDRIVIDDPLNPEEAVSDTKRETANRFFDTTLASRVRDKQRPVYVVVMQRLHEDDLSGHVRGEGWVRLVLPAVAEADEAHVGPLSGTVYTRAAGELLWAAREGPEQVALQRVVLGEYGFSGQYQQRPSPAEGGIFKRENWRYFRHAELPELLERMEAIRSSWDMTFKDREDNDFVAALVGGRIGADIYVYDGFHARMDFAATLKRYRAFAVAHPEALEKLVEDTANGPAIISTLKHEVPGIIPVTPTGGKLARARAVSPLQEAGNVWLPHPDECPWVAELIEEAAAFPNGAHDDYVDALSQLLARFTAGSVFDFYRARAEASA